MLKNRKIIIPKNLIVNPNELRVAKILAKNSFIVEFLKPLNTYKAKTPDILLNNVPFEIKSPIGKSKTTMQYAIKRGLKQSKNLIIDTSQTKLSDERLLNDIRYQIKIVTEIKKLFVIDKKSNLPRFIIKKCHRRLFFHH